MRFAFRPGVTAVHHDRRSSPRLEIDACLAGDVLGQPQQSLALRDLALSGFSVQTSQACAVGRRYNFRFAIDGGLAVRLAAEAVYCRPGDQSDDTRFVNGFRFVADTPEAEAAIDLLMDSATAPLSFD